MSEVSLKIIPWFDLWFSHFDTVFSRHDFMVSRFAINLYFISN